ncbi:DJ-1 family glyoxalase III [Thiohalomonas denitrificans]|uniref:4-methyl-5(B-hydroxyethyl)-thiazole monophosphate biosynthesis n=1 Tax=Thiohalomonas denitrificans TaxID=415747 RepID=A0A1G5QTQ6_9GAMM|nr:DJ-1 family glyoxalase III [Thiohalomonas denitrificans]SCZ65056.1 4-methyl-5(b-hydroxyethyl)-thiazole monophosphate biosynthesis [Thiohalomonas denitrificans]
MASVLVPLAEGCEELEAVTIIDLLVRGGIDVLTAGLTEGPVKASRGVTLLPDTTLTEALAHDFDMVVLPGGAPGAERLDNDPRIGELLKKMASKERYIAAICAAPKVLANAGLLTGRQATSFPGFIDTMEFSNLTYLEDPVVQDGKVVTSRGPGTAMDFALHLVELLAGKAKRDEVEASLQRP